MNSRKSSDVWRQIEPTTLYAMMDLIAAGNKLVSLYAQNSPVNTQPALWDEWNVICQAVYELDFPLAVSLWKQFGQSIPPGADKQFAKDVKRRLKPVLLKIKLELKKGGLIPPPATPAEQAAPVKNEIDPTPVLLSWREIIEALGRKNSLEFKRQLSRLNAKKNGPIIPGSKGQQPSVDRNALVRWFNGLSDAHIINEATQTSMLEESDTAGQRVFDGKIALGTVKKNQRPTGKLQRKR